MNVNKLIVTGILGLIVIFVILGLSLLQPKPEPTAPAATVVDQNLLYLAHAGMVLNREFDYVVRIDRKSVV